MSYFQKVLINYFFFLRSLVFCSDLALRNCLLTSDVKVKIGDYGLSHNKYKVCQMCTIIMNITDYIHLLVDVVLFDSKSG